MKQKENGMCGWFVFCGNQLLIKKENGGYHIPYSAEPPAEVPEGKTVHVIGTVEGMTAKAFAITSPVDGDENSPQMMT